MIQIKIKRMIAYVARLSRLFNFGILRDTAKYDLYNDIVHAQKGPLEVNGILLLQE